LKLHGGDDAIPIKVVLFVSLLNNDNQEAYSLCGINMRSVSENCRICPINKLVMNSTIVSLRDDIFRNSAETMHLLHQHQSNFIRYLIAPRNSRRNDIYVQEASALKEKGILPGLNPLISNFDWLNHYQIGNIFTCSSVDVLHTLYKGPVEYAIKWSVSCFYLLSGKDSLMVSQLDSRIKLFQPQALNPFQKFKTFPHGISYFFGNSQSNPKAMENAIMSSNGLEAQHMSSLLFYLMFSIGTQGKFISNNNVIHLNLNPTRVILECLQSILDVLWLVNSDEIPANEIMKLETKFNIMNSKLQLLWVLKQRLTNSTKTLKVVKCHLCMHMPYNWLQFGRIKDIDTALAEHSHIQDKSTFQQTSKRMLSTHREMLQKVSIQLREKTLKNQCFRNAQISNNPNSPDDEEGIIYAPISRISFQKFYFDTSTDQWFHHNQQSYFHPYLTMKKFNEILIRYSQSGSDELELIAKTLHDSPIISIQGISINPNKESGISKFSVYATNNYNKSSQVRYDAL
jgi:hypothetical protein